MLLQDSDPLVQAVVGDGGAAVAAGAVVVHHPPALPLQRGCAGSGGRGGLQLREPEHGGPGGGQKHEEEPVQHRGFRMSSVNGPGAFVDERRHGGGKWTTRGGGEGASG